MGELYNPFPKLPKNIRQIGERDQSVRLYLEDYVNTYLKRLYPKGGQDLRVGLLLGLAEEHDGVPYLFVDGAMEMDDVTEHGEKVAFTETAWKKAYQAMEQMFPKRTILGWFLCGSPDSTLSPLNYWKQHGQYFAGKNQLMYLNSGLEGEEAVYVTSEDGFYRLRGYSIYYERNQMMQDYMISRKDARRVESGSGDTVIRDFRQRMEDNKNQVTARRGTIRVLGSVCSALAVVVLAGGVVMINNYQKMKKMEAVLASALPAGSSLGTSLGKEGEEELPGEDLLVEEVSGQVYPTIAKETMSDTYPQELSTAAATIEEIQLQPTSGGGTSGPEADQSANQAGQSGPGQSTAGQSGPGQSTAGQSTSQAGQGTGPAASQGANAAASQAGQTLYQVQEGETLYGICLKVYGNGRMLEEICRINGLEDQDKIISGQNLILP